MKPRLLLALLFALLLPFAQAAAAVHELSHVRASVQDKSAPATLHCDVCAIAAGLAGGAAAHEPGVAATAAPPAPPIAHVFAEPRSPRTISAFLSRAPPTLH